MDDIVLTGCAYTPEFKEGYHGTLFHVSDMTPQFAESIVGLPVYIEHDTGIPIGCVTDAHIDYSSRLIVTIKVYGNTIVTSLLPPKLASRFYAGLSLGHAVQFKMGDDGTVGVHSLTPTEISIVRKGDREGTDIFHYQVVSRA